MTKQDKIRLGKVEVKMGAETVSLTVEQARELSALLKGLFGDDSTKIIHVQDYWYWRPWYMGPNWSYNGSNWSATISNNPDSSSTSVFTLSAVSSS